MKFSRRLVIWIFALLVILFVGMLNWSFVLNEIIQPVSLVIWLLLRVFVLSIDQQYYWWALILIMLALIYRLLPHDQSANFTEDVKNPNETLRTIEHWRLLFVPGENRGFSDRFVEREFTHTVISLYALKLHATPDFQLFDALRNGTIPIPEDIRAYLFMNEPKKEKRTIKTLVQSMANAPRNWIYHWSGQDIADHYRMIEKILDFLETSLEMNDDGKFNAN